MKDKNPFTFNKVWLMAGLSLLAAFAGCVVEPSSGYRGDIQADDDYQDDYVYYPEYETYYCYNRHEFMYLDGGIWVRRPQPPRGISLNVILAAPSVRLDFHDSPEHHHSTVVRSYPRNWRGPDSHHPVVQERTNAQSQRVNVQPDRRNVQPERHDVRPEQHEATPERQVVKPAPAAPKPEHRAIKPKAPVKKKIAPQEQPRENKPEEKQDEHKDERKDDKHDDQRGPNR